MNRPWIVPLLCGLALACSGPDPGATRNAPGGSAIDTTTGAVDGGRVVIGVQQEPEILSEILNSVENGGVSADHLEYTYHLRKDARWHDGEPVTSRDVKFTYEIIMDPNVSVESREGWDVVESVATPDDHTVVFRLQRPYPDFASETFYDESVLPEHLLRDSRGARFQSAAFHRAPVGSGPFRFESWAPGSHLVLVANRDYYGEGPHLDAIIFKFVPTENALLVQLKTGEIDMFDNANISFISQLDAIDGIRVYRTPMLMYEHLDLNTENEILRDVRVRRALSCATNKTEIAERIYNGLVRVAVLDEFEESRYYSHAAAQRSGYDPAQARLLLHEAGWRDSDGDGILDRNGVPLRLTISASSGQPNRERTELVLRDQYRAVGIDLVIENYGPTVLYGTYEDGGVLKRGTFDIAMYAWLSSPGPSRREALYAAESIPPNGQNHPRFKHAELTELLDRAGTETDEASREALYRRVQEILVDEVPVIPLFWYTAIDPVTHRLRNFRPNATQSADTWNAAQWYLAAPAAQVSTR
jgi:peptide/nickel transport system substrate-binding protein